MRDVTFFLIRLKLNNKALYTKFCKQKKIYNFYIRIWILLLWHILDFTFCLFICLCDILNCFFSVWLVVCLALFFFVNNLAPMDSLSLLLLWTGPSTTTSYACSILQLIGLKNGLGIISINFLISIDLKVIISQIHWLFVNFDILDIFFVFYTFVVRRRPL